MTTHRAAVRLITARCNVLLSTVAEMLALSEATAEALLLKHGWDVTTVVDRYLNKETVCRHCCGLSPTGVAMAKDPEDLPSGPDAPTCLVGSNLASYGIL